MNNLMEQNIEDLINANLLAQTEAIIEKIMNDKREFLTCVCVAKIVREAYVLQKPNPVTDIYTSRAVPFN